VDGGTNTETEQARVLRYKS